ncbi:MAG: hypothetical protein A2Z16_06420 [Chloroflexi bacterium RBG_16_54_18]|nr:MAG: hypothetical protein A2Z16_06420 [Chloroflexi bacterium RBG_16_54_18]
MRNFGMILLAIWLILYGAIPLIGISIPSADLILAILAVAAGLLILLGQRRFHFKGNFGFLLLAVWLILVGLLQLINIGFPASGTVTAILAIAAGVFLLIRR